MKKILVFLLIVFSCTYAFASHHIGWGLNVPYHRLDVISLDGEGKFIVHVDTNFCNGEPDTVLLICGKRISKLTAGSSQICNKSKGEEASIRILEEDFHNGSIGTFEFLDSVTQ